LSIGADDASRKTAEKAVAFQFVILDIDFLLRELETTVEFAHGGHQLSEHFVTDR